MHFSVDSWLVASVGRFDKLVKIWKRTSFDKDNVDFDFNYIPHPARILRMRWQQPFDLSQSIENTLYTLADDKVVRIWSPFDSTDAGNFQLWASIDLEGHHFGLMLDNRDLSRAIESSLVSGVGDDKEMSEDLKNVINLAQKAPEICITFNKDTQRISAYTIENIGLKKQKLVKVVKVVDNERLIISKAGMFPFGSNRLDFFTYAAQPSKSVKSSANLSILVHDYHGTIYNFSIDIAQLLNVKQDIARNLQLKSILTGHNKSVRQIVRSGGGNLLLTQSRFSENALWKPYVLPIGVTLRKCSLLQPDSDCKVIHSVLVANDDYVITLLDSKELIVWDCHRETAKPIASSRVKCNDEPKCMFLLPEPESEAIHLIIVYNESNVFVYSIKIVKEGEDGSSINYIGNFPLPFDEEEKDDGDEKLHLAVPVDPVGWNVTIGSSLDTFQREVLMTVSKDGWLIGWTARINSDKHLEWLETSSVNTGEKDIIRAQVSSTRKVAIANSDGTELSIYDTSNSLLEFKEKFSPENSISDLDWTTAPDNQCVLGVGFSQQIVLYCQQRFDYTNKTPSWAPFRRVDISRYTSHKIGDSIWLKDGTFVVGAGNQIFIQDHNADIEDETTRSLLGSRYTRATLDNINTIFDIVSVLNGPLPLYHPQLLIQSILADKLDMVKKIVCILLKRLRFATISELKVANIQSHLGIDTAQLVLFGDAFWKQQQEFADDQYDEFNSKVCEDLNDWLQKVSLPYLTRHQQITLASVIEALAYINEHARSLDSNGIKYLLGFKLFKIHKGIQDSMSMRDFNWALHSESQNLLLDMVKQSSSGPLLWPPMREVGVSFWLRNEPLKELFEILGKNYFSSGGQRDPVKCTLYYLALRRKQILIGLWRTASWHKEQQRIIQLLSRDFSDERWKSAARKNAFALLGKHRYEYAASFFLLADSLKDAINVLVRNVNDLPLAIAVARVYEGDNGKELRNLIKTHIIPNANTSGDRWLMSWALWSLKERQASINALAWGMAEDKDDFLLQSQLPKSQHQQHQIQGRSMSFLVDDPVLIMLYRYLQQRENKRAPSQTPNIYSSLPSPIIKPNNGGTQTPQKHFSAKKDTEFKFVLKTASILTRMGCDILALDLIKGWNFSYALAKPKDVGISSASSISVASEDLLSLASNIANSNLPTASKEEALNEKKRHNNLQPVASVAFQEPDMSAFDFGF